MRFKAITILLLFSGAFQIQAQTKDRSGFTYGGGFGVLFASNKNAMYYNGADDKPDAVRNITGSPYYKDQIYNILKDDIKSISYPSKMTYSPAVTLHGYLAYIIKNKNSVYCQITYAKCTTNGVFTLELATPDPNDSYGSTRYYECGIKASEQRVDIELGYHLLLKNEGKYKPFLEVFGNINTVQVKSHQMQIGTLTASLYQSSYTSTYSNQSQAKAGYGFGATLGVEAPLFGRMFYNIGIQGSLKTIHLSDNPTLTPHEIIFARVIF